MSALLLNGTEFKPSGIQRDEVRIGTSLVSANGTRTFMLRGIKTNTTLTWEKVSASVLQAVSNIFHLGSTFAFQDELGVTRTVQCESDSFSYSIATIGAGNVVTYTVTLKLYEA